MPSVPSVPGRGYSFTDFQTFQPSTPLPGNKVDQELDRINNFNAELVPWLRVSINDDGSIKANAADTALVIASLTGVAGITWRGNYAPATTYARLDVVFDQNSSWLCISDTPASGTAPPTLPATSNSKWVLLARAGANGVDGVSPVLSTLVAKDSGTGGALLPTGTTAQRPPSPAPGQLRYNTSLSTLEVFTGSAWSSVGSSQVFPVDQTFTAIAGQTTFSLTYTPGTIQVFKNGSLLDMGVDVTASNGSAVIIATPCDVGDIIQVLGWGSFSVANALAKDQNLADLPDPTLARASLGINNAALRAIATAAEYRSVTANRAVGLSEAYAAADLVVLTDAANVALDLNTGVNFVLTATAGVGATRQLNNPTNAPVGKTGVIIFIQDGTGNRALTFAANYDHPGGTAPSTSTAANAVDAFSYWVRSSTSILILPLGRGFA